MTDNQTPNLDRSETPLPLLSVKPHSDSSFGHIWTLCYSGHYMQHLSYPSSYIRTWFWTVWGSPSLVLDICTSRGATMLRLYSNNIIQLQFVLTSRTIHTIRVKALIIIFIYSEKSISTYHWYKGQLGSFPLSSKDLIKMLYNSWSMYITLTSIECINMRLLKHKEDSVTWANKGLKGQLITMIQRKLIFIT